LPPGPRSAVALIALAAACSRGLPAPDAEERAQLARAALVAPDPSAGCRQGELPAVDGTRMRIAVAHEERSYLLDAPAVPADRPLPVVVSLHGFRGSARSQRGWTGFGRLARAEGFIAVHPEGRDDVHLLDTTGRGWDVRPSDTQDAAFIALVLDRLEHERCVDRRRVFATGMSNGGFFANLLGCRLAGRLAAIAPVAGAMPLAGCVPAEPVAVLLLHGRADRLVRSPVVRAAHAWWTRADRCRASTEHDGCVRDEGCAADVVYCEGAQAHRWPRDATARIWRFFQSHPRASMNGQVAWVLR
jgi:poly(3-hydroxybutyrate) depolymerase